MRAAKMMKKKKRGGEGLNQQTDTNFYFLFHKLSNYTQSVFVLTHGCDVSKNENERICWNWNSELNSKQ